MRADESETAAAQGAGATRKRKVLCGEGMLVVVRGFTEGDDRFLAGVTYVVPDHPIARRYPERFKPAMAEDTSPAIERFRSLQAKSRVYGVPDRTDFEPDWRL